MNAEQAYPRMPSYDQRQTQHFETGDRVTVGPAYQMGGTYAIDGTEGDYFVVGHSGPLDYKLSKYRSDDDWSVIVHVTRLTNRS